jgi:D-alanyl-D-alanine carboxypeptidase/D-alanyl-D-alanine-endopeptidase (penicillin-binding protein 4)
MVLAAPDSRAAGQIDIGRALKNPGFNPSHTSVSIVDAETGEVIAAHNSDLALNPASCMKLITSAAALSLLGPDYRFKTDFYADRQVKNGTIGMLYVAGTGDPLLVSEQIWRIARVLYDMGLRKITGGIVVDDSFFDSYDVPKKPGEEYRAFSAKTAATAVNFNSVTIHIAPGEPGTPAIVTADPPTEYFKIANKVMTGGKYAADAFSTLENGHEVLTVRGTIPESFSVAEVYRSIADPSAYAGYVMKYVLEQNGIAVAGQVSRGGVPSGARLLTSEVSKPLATIIREMNKFSNNFIAEQVVKHLGSVRYGRPGSTEKGLKAMQEYLAALGIRPDGYTIENGSGLSEKTRLSSAQLARLLSAAYQDFTIRPEFMASLSIVGVDGTTRRWKKESALNGLVRAKTGTLNNVSTFAGYVPMKDGRIAAFAILANGLPKGAAAAHDAELMLVKAAAEAQR